MTGYAIISIIPNGSMNLFCDTNIWLRYFIGDHTEHSHLVASILDYNEQGKLHLSTSTFILSEFIYVEKSFYKISRKDILTDLDAIVEVRNLLLIEETHFWDSLRRFKMLRSKDSKWSDCIIAAQIPNNYLLCSFDDRLEKLVGKGRYIHPKAVIHEMSS